MKLQPVALDERVEAIDLMRGFALLGILLINMLAFHSPLYYIDPYTWFDAPGDPQTFTFLDIFIQASFYPLFAMLFGYGLGIQFLRAEARKKAFAPLAVKRLAVLLVFGTLHAFLIWYGDILITYAIMGFLLIGMMRLESKWLLWLGIIIYVIPQTLLLTVMFAAVALDSSFYVGIQEVQNSIAAYGGGSFAEIFRQRFDDWMYGNNPLNYIILVVTILPFTMVGAAAAKWRLIERTKELKKVWLVLAAGGFLAGLLLKIAPYIFEPNIAMTYLQEIFGGPLLAVSYAAVITLIVQNANVARLFRPLSKVGRMSLTTYITQSIIATTIFYSYGLGLYGQVSLLTGTLLALGIFAVQLIFAEIWLTKFSQGPLEMIWRKITYGLNFEKSNKSNN
ncbi:DUF418 domain-containing protein [Planomicrobium sp. Y74]|uniref:DUF418 domain-containing protein n=1 Tax=Planomicrobium sp. Y74 TaxID=2478977 RepID=UPI000EF49794|nr:DUF418 domain-containing protein [Planomicrobium sp. Y74]RLQ92994.1 DUF418 domain-containing protein [Planomicrobium sp. Y74]